MGRVLLRILPFALASLALTLSLWSATWGWSEIAVSAARADLKGWSNGARHFDFAVWRRVEQALLRACRLHPRDTGCHADLGRLYEWRAWQHTDQRKRAEAYRRRALEHYRAALVLRPSWALGWADRAGALGLTEGVSAAMLESFDAALTLGRHEAVVQRRLVWPGVAFWEQLPEVSRQLLADAVAHGLVFGVFPDRLKGLATQYQWSLPLEAISRAALAQRAAPRRRGS